MEGVGQVQVMLSVDEEENSSLYTSSNNVPSVTGVLILCDGADDATVVQNISDAVMALFQIEIHKIKVGKRTTKGESP
jgi:stage III sporulation protein AG